MGSEHRHQKVCSAGDHLSRTTEEVKTIDKVMLENSCLREKQKWMRDTGTHRETKKSEVFFKAYCFMNYITNGIEIVALEVFMKVLEQN